MYVILLGTTSVMGTLAWKPNLRDYARWEYGRSDTAWLLARARTSRGRKRGAGLRARIREWLRASRSLPATAAVAEIENLSR